MKIFLCLRTEIYKYPREFFRLFYKDYADGIICGLNYFFDGEKNLILSSGVILLDEKFYFLEKDLNISDLVKKNNLADGRDYYIFPQKKSPCLTENKLILTFSEEKKILCSANFALNPPIILICRRYRTAKMYLKIFFNQAG